jgi:hypothetical protein
MRSGHEPWENQETWQGSSPCLSRTCFSMPEDCYNLLPGINDNIHDSINFRRKFVLFHDPKFRWDMVVTTVGSFGTSKEYDYESHRDHLGRPSICHQLLFLGVSQRSHIWRITNNVLASNVIWYYSPGDCRRQNAQPKVVSKSSTQLTIDKSHIYHVRYRISSFFTLTGRGFSGHKNSFARFSHVLHQFIK